MKITKRQLKRIIREEYSRLKRRGLLRESIDSLPGDLLTKINVLIKNNIPQGEQMLVSFGSSFIEYLMSSHGYDAVMEENPDFDPTELGMDEFHSVLSKAPAKAKRLAMDPAIEEAREIMIEDGGTSGPLKILRSLVSEGIAYGTQQDAEYVCMCLGEAGLRTTPYSYRPDDPYHPFVAGHNIVLINFPGDQGLVIIDDYRK